jgi:hypothetical protein
MTANAAAVAAPQPRAIQGPMPAESQAPCGYPAIDDVARWLGQASSPPSAMPATAAWPCATDVGVADAPVRDARPAPTGDAVEAKRLAAALVRALDPLPPVRLHVEWSGSSARVWIGLDVPAASHLPALVANLSRWMERAGTRLRSVTCNGTVCFAGGTGATTAGQPTVDPSSSRAATSSQTIVDVIVEREN